MEYAECVTIEILEDNFIDPANAEFQNLHVSLEDVQLMEDSSNN
jgi:hypothetical protein